MEILNLFFGFALLHLVFSRVRLSRQRLTHETFQSNLQAAYQRYVSYEGDLSNLECSYKSTNSPRVRTRRSTWHQNILAMSKAEYVVSITVGSPGQDFEALVDTGSGDFLIPDESCKWYQNPGSKASQKELCRSYCRGDDACCQRLFLVGPCNPEHQFRRDASSSFEITETSTSDITYASITAKALYGKDVVEFGGNYDLENGHLLSLGNFTFALATSMYSNSPGSHKPLILTILGLGPTSAHPENSLPVLTQLFQNKKIHFDNLLFHLILNFDCVEGGLIDYGSAEPYSEICEKEVVTVLYPADSYSFCISNSISLEGTDPGQGGELPVAAIIDSGTNAILGPPDKVKKLAADVGATPQANGHYTIDCEKQNTGRDIVFKTPSEKKLRVSSHNYVIQVH
ncbi:hypothetical protein L596_027497 [Steinernema carpocapsae]|uniref:Peptidase A1 domain-containing protein n=1 Tax=Steinernema carpocapsae TaxID=34508 RepID=A0A4U5LVP2_STECR|nr:hypothetical protein L596_027497 [Steinernema carpocapsae]